ncbi:histone deacetylase family protein [Sagittula stellata]|nr:histone deacetylase family protein [Sagittula stellata]
MRIFTSDAHLGHRARMEFVPGQMVPAIETPDRIDAVLRGLDRHGFAAPIEADPAAHEDLRLVHSEAFLAFLKSAWTEWEAAFGPELDGYGFVWPTRNAFGRIPEAIEGKIGHFCFDGVSGLTPGMWMASVGAAGAALAAARSVLAGEGHAFAACRPPGHHASADLMGGTSYLNNAALAAAWMANQGARVATVDIDAHHGNGTQSVFWARGDVLTTSLHIDPAHDYPYFTGYADERGEGAGAGLNLNAPLAVGSEGDAFLSSLSEVLSDVRRFSPDYLIVPLGVDGFVGDPVGKMSLSTKDFARIGDALADLGLPTVFTMEGGYSTEALETCVPMVLHPFRG